MSGSGSIRVVVAAFAVLWLASQDLFAAEGIADRFKELVPGIGLGMSPEELQKAMPDVAPLTGELYQLAKDGEGNVLKMPEEFSGTPLDVISKSSVFYMFVFRDNQLSSAVAMFSRSEKGFPESARRYVQKTVEAGATRRIAPMPGETLPMLLLEEGEAGTTIVWRKDRGPAEQRVPRLVISLTKEIRSEFPKPPATQEEHDLFTSHLIDIGCKADAGMEAKP